MGGWIDRWMERNRYQKYRGRFYSLINQLGLQAQQYAAAWCPVPPDPLLPSPYPLEVLVVRMAIAYDVLHRITGMMCAREAWWR
jgi:hypothetical protein